MCSQTSPRFAPLQLMLHKSVISNTAAGRGETRDGAVIFHLNNTPQLQPALTGTHPAGPGSPISPCMRMFSPRLIFAILHIIISGCGAECYFDFTLSNEENSAEDDCVQR